MYRSNVLGFAAAPVLYIAQALEIDRDRSGVAVFAIQKIPLEQYCLKDMVDGELGFVVRAIPVFDKGFEFLLRKLRAVPRQYLTARRQQPGQQTGNNFRCGFHAWYDKYVKSAPSRN